MSDRDARSLPPARRRWGQNFLSDPGLTAKLARFFAAGPEDRIVEIGPGRGALTRHLAPEAGRFIALEIDPLLIEALAPLLAPHARAEVRHADALEVDWAALAAELGGELRVIGNLPYNVGTPIVRRLLASDAVCDIQAVLQLEVVERFLAEPGSKTFGPLAVVASLRASRRRLAVLAPGSFHPRPKVRSAVLRLERLAEPVVSSAELPALEELLFRAFAQRRKTLASNLKPERETVRAFLDEEGLPADARAEIVPAAAWPRLLARLAADEASPRRPV